MTNKIKQHRSQSPRVVSSSYSRNLAIDPRQKVKEISYISYNKFSQTNYSFTKYVEKLHFLFEVIVIPTIFGDSRSRKLNIQQFHSCQSCDIFFGAFIPKQNK